MLEVLGLILPLFGLILLGYLGARITNQPIEALGWLNTFVVYFALPALFFKLLSKTPVEELASGKFIFTNIGVTYAVFVVIFCFGLLTSRGRISDATIQGLSGAYGNIGYMGPALAILTLGEKAAIPVAIIFCFENIMHFAVAPAMMAASGEKQQSVLELLREVAQKIFFHPFIIATAVGVGAAFLNYSPPVPIERLIEYLAQAAAPCALFAMGVTLALRPLKRVPLELGYIVPMKLIFHPLAMYFALVFVGISDPIWLFSAVLLASLPTATNVFVIAQQYNVWVERASASILISTVASVVTVSVLLYMISNSLIPVPGSGN